MPDRPSFPPPKRGRPTREQREWASRKRQNEPRKPRTVRGIYGWLGVLAVAAIAGISSWPGVMSVDGRSLLSGGASENSSTSDTFSCRVSSVQDGDTLTCGDGTRVRLHAVAAREKNETCRPGHPCPEASAASATAKLRELTLGKTLACERTAASYERATAICRTEAKVEINCAMVKSGTAVVWPKYDKQRAICGGGG